MVETMDNSQTTTRKSAAAAPPGRQQLSLTLHRIGAIKFGQFTLKSGLVSPVYLDLRVLVSHPRALRGVGHALAGLVTPLHFDRIAAIPYAAIPIATTLALEIERPLIYPRKEVKDYGTRRTIEGQFEAGETALVIDDLITTGGSKLEAIAPLEAAGLRVRDVAVLIDRQGGGAAQLAAHGYRLHSVLTLTQMLDVLAEARAITTEQRSEVLAWLRSES